MTTIADRNHFVNTAQATRLYHNYRAALIGMGVCAGVMAAVLWDQASQGPLLAWLVAVASVMLVRALLAYGHFRRDDDNPERWIRRYTCLELYSGVVWGASGLFFFQLDLSHSLFLVFVLAGMTAAAVPLLAPSMGAFVAFVTPALVIPSLLINLAGTNVTLGMSLLGLAYLAAVTYVVDTLHRALREGLEFAYDNQRLLGRAESANRQLRLEIEQHRATADTLRSTKKALQRLSDRQATILAHSPAGIMLLDADMCVEYGNPEILQMVGIEPSQGHGVVGQPVLELPLVQEAEELVTHYHRLCAGERVEFTLRHEWPTGEVLNLAATAVPLFDESGLAGAVVVAADISERLKVEAALRHARDQAEAANQAKSEFVTNITHELRTPLNGIIGITELLRTTAITEEQREYLSLIELSSDNLLQLVNQLLELARLQAGRQLGHAAAVNLKRLLEVDLSFLKLSARNKGLGFRVTIDPRVPADLVSDPGMLRQILTNLIGNAVKYTDEGQVSLSVAVAEERPGEGVSLHFRIEDTGVGIPRERLEEIFEPFTQVDGSAARRHGGTGLGTTIARELAAQLGGRIWAESELGRGSVFHLLLPVETNVRPLPQGAPASPRPAPGGRDRLDVLVAEDNRVNQIVARKILETEGHRVTVVENGQQAVAAAGSGGFDIILMDIQMPGMDGIQATQLIRLEERSRGGHVAIIAMTAHTLEQDRQRCLEAGMDGYLEKPIQRDSLTVAIWEVLERLRRAATPDSSPRS